MMKYRKKPVVIEAIQLKTINWEEICKLTKGYEIEGFYVGEDEMELKIHTLEGTMTVNNGDWIVKGVKGEIYPCKPDIFEATYEKVEEE